MRRALLILGLAMMMTVPLHAQKLSVYDCYVLEAGDDGSGYIVLGIAKDGDFVFKNRYPLSNLDMVKSQCRTEIARLQSKDAKPIPLGKVDISLPAIEPEPQPTQDELDLAAFQAKVELATKLAVVLPPDDKDLAALRAEIADDLKTHPDWKSSI